MARLPHDAPHLSHPACRCVAGHRRTSPSSQRDRTDGDIQKRSKTLKFAPPQLSDRDGHSEIEAGTLRSAPLRAFLLRAECAGVPQAKGIAPETATDTAADTGLGGASLVRCPQCEAVIGVPPGVAIGGEFSCTCGERLRLQTV